MTMPPCRAFVLEAGAGASLATDAPRLIGVVEDSARALGLPTASGTLWLGARPTPAGTPVGWTCWAGTHYCWQATSGNDPVPLGVTLLAKLTIAGGQLTGVLDVRADSPQPGPANLRSPLYGAVGDCLTDDTAAVQMWINNTVARRMTGVAPAGCYLIDRVWFTYDAVHNPNYPQDIQFQGNIKLSGAGSIQAGMSGMPKDRRYGTIFVSTATDAPMFNGAGDHVNFAFRGLRLEGFSLDQTTTSEVMKFEDLHSRAWLEDMFLINRGTGGGITWSDLFLVRMQDLFVMTNNDASVGHGIWLYNVTNLGGIVELANVTGRGFVGGTCVRIGVTTDLDEKVLASVNLVGVQGQSCQVGIALLGAATGSVIQGGYTEGTTQYAVEIGHNAIGATVLGGYFDVDKHLDATDAGIKIGNSTGGLADRALAVNVMGARITRLNKGYGIWRDYSPQNTRGGVIQGNILDGNVGGTAVGIYCGTGGATTEESLVIQGNTFNENVPIGVDATCRSGDIIQDELGIWFGRRVNMGQGLVLASAATVVLPTNGNAYNLTGSATVTTITCTPCTPGATITFFAQSTHTPSLAQGGNIHLSDADGNVWNGTAYGVISLLYDGVSWRELFRSNN